MSLVNQCGLAPRSKALVLRTWTREVSSPTDRTFQISFAVAASTLAGYWAADLPIERPARFELVGNLKIAKGLGMTIPEAILLRADEIIDRRGATSALGTKRTIRPQSTHFRY